MLINHNMIHNDINFINHCVAKQNIKILQRKYNKI